MDEEVQEGKWAKPRMYILAPVQLPALNLGVDLHFALRHEHCLMSISLHSVFNDCVIVLQVDILYFICSPDLSWETDALCPKPDFFAAPPEVLETVGSSQQAQACTSGSLFLSRDLPGQKVGCAFHVGGAALPPPPCSRVYVEYFLPRVPLFRVAGDRELSHRLPEGHPLPQALPWVGSDAGLCGACAGLTHCVAGQVGLRQGSDTKVVGAIEFPGS